MHVTYHGVTYHEIWLHNAHLFWSIDWLSIILNKYTRSKIMIRFFFERHWHNPAYKDWWYHIDIRLVQIFKYAQCVVFSCPGQLNRWPCHSLSESETFDFSNFRRKWLQWLGWCHHCGERLRWWTSEEVNVWFTQGVVNVWGCERLIYTGGGERLRWWASGHTFYLSQTPQTVSV